MADDFRINHKENKNDSQNVEQRKTVGQPTRLKIIIMRKNKGIIALTIVAVLAHGCATPVINVSLNTPDTAKSQSVVIVKDVRIDKQIYMTGIGFDSSTYINLLTTEPSMEVVLERHISLALSKLPMMPVRKVQITLEELDLKNKVGFGTNDEIYCKIESSVVALNDTTSPLKQRVKTFSKNMENMSPMVRTVGKIILDQCLEQHALEIVSKMSAWR